MSDFLNSKKVDWTLLISFVFVFSVVSFMPNLVFPVFLRFLFPFDNPEDFRFSAVHSFVFLQIGLSLLYVQLLRNDFNKPVVFIFAFMNFAILFSFNHGFSRNVIFLFLLSGLVLITKEEIGKYRKNLYKQIHKGRL